ncbi:4705_t:CDS:2, partial [Dentiscutata heterogama]
IGHDIINISLSLCVNSRSRLEKIEIYPEKGEVILKRNKRSIRIGHVNKSLTAEDIKDAKYPEFKFTDKDKNDPMGFYAEYENGIITSNKKDILAGNKLKVANIYREFLQIDARIPLQTDPGIYLTAPFYDPNSEVKKIKYYENIKNYLNEQNSTKILDPSKINGAINFNLNQEELTESNKMMFLKPVHIDDDNLANDINIQMTNFNELMRTCYHAINYNAHIFSQSEIQRRMSLRSLYTFEQACREMKEWIKKWAAKKIINLKKGEKSTTKYIHFAGPRLTELIKALNNNWTTFDLVDDIRITWLENFRKNEWDEFIKCIKYQWIRF